MCILESVKYTKKMEFEYSKWLLKMRDIIYYKRINVFATEILALSALIEPNTWGEEKATRFKVTTGMHPSADILAKEMHRREQKPPFADRYVLCLHIGVKMDWLE